MLHDKAQALAKRFLGLPPAQRRTFLAKLRDQGLDAGALPLVEAGDIERQPHGQARGVGKLVQAGELRRVKRVFFRDAVKRVSGAHDVYFHVISPFIYAIH